MIELILKPEILTHPHIPKPLHGLSPRTIMGKEWWDKTRQEVYARYNYHCIACGVEKYNALGHKWLEGHEFWHIDYATGICTITSIEPLCNYCHNFIHSGRLSMVIGKEISRDIAIKILEHGFKILADNKLECFPFTLKLAENLGANTFGVKAYELPNAIVDWSDWKLIWNGKTYQSTFSSIDEWVEYYRKGETK